MSASHPRIGLYGGSFDPFHLGHLLVAQSALEELELDRLVFLPAARSPFKPGTVPAPASLRTAMIRRALSGRPDFEVDPIEVERGGISYSIDTVREYRRRHPLGSLFWLIGADHVAQLHEWREARELAESVTFAVIPRPGQPDVSRPAPWKLVHLRGWPLSVSSSEIRERVRLHRTISHLVPPTVMETIAAEHLYRSRPNEDPQG